MIARPRRQGMMVLAWILVLAGILLMMGGMGSFQVSSTRRTLETVHAHRVIDLATQSAFEEACGLLESEVPFLPFVFADKWIKNNWAKLRRPRTYPVESTSSCFAPEGIEVSPVVLVCSEVVPHVDPPPPANPTSLAEFGIVQLEVQLSMRTTFGVLKRRVTARRFFSLDPAPRRPGVNLRVRPANVMVTVSET